MPPIPPKVQKKVSSKEVLETAAMFPRQHIGDFIYSSELKPQRLVPQPQNYRGFVSRPAPLPWSLIRDKVNSILTVKVPRVFLSRESREEITARGYLWGTNVYTDDSDVIAACIHGGWIMGEWNEEVDMALIDPEGDKRKRRDFTRDELVSEQLVSAPPEAGPMPIPAGRDLHVNVLILPRLTKYTATTQWGIRSREFGGEHGSRHITHDGLSFMIHGIRWVANGAEPQARLRGKARRERMRKAMQETRVTQQTGHTERIRSDGWMKQQLEDKEKKKAAGTTSGEQGNDNDNNEGNKENRDASEHATPAKQSSEEGQEHKAPDVEMEEAPADGSAGAKD